MEIVNFGHFTSYSQGDGILYFQNEVGQDWYGLRFSLTTWAENGAFVDAIYGAWAMVDPSTMRVTNVEYDPSRLMPGDRIVLGIDADHTTIKPGLLYTGAALIDQAIPPTEADVDAERDRRIAAGFTFEGVFYQSRTEDRENIAGAKSAATDAIAAGAMPGDYGWRQLLDPNGPEVFGWIAEDNSAVPMDAQTVVRFAYAALGHKEAHIFAARSLKNRATIPADYATNPAYWP
jgi:hypothetical protein